MVYITPIDNRVFPTPNATQPRYDIQTFSAHELHIITTHEEVMGCIKKQFNRIDKSSIVKLSRLILTQAHDDIEVSQFKEKYKSFILKNPKRVEEVEKENGKRYYMLKRDIVARLRDMITLIATRIGSSIREIDDEDEEKWSKCQLEDDVYEVTPGTTFQEIREKVNKEGKDANFKFPFKKNELTVNKFKNKMGLQLVEVYVNNDGEMFGFPLNYTYQCPECNNVSYKMEYEVCSTNKKIKCPGLVEVVKDNGKVDYKKCSLMLSPDINRTETKDAFVYGISFIDEHGNEVTADAISFIKLPKGQLKVVLQKISRPYSKEIVFIIDYEPIEKNIMRLPDKKDDEHYIFTLVKAIDEYIIEQTGYKYFGFLPVKMAMIIQMFGRYLPTFKNNYHISLTGELSSGKSEFARYWGIALYAESILLSVSTSISIAKLRGTMESFTLFDKEYRYQYKGLLGEIDMLVIDELKEEPDVKNNLKQYLLEPTFEYSKQGSKNQVYKRTSQCIVTENIDTKHLDRYVKEIKKLYQSDNLRLIREEQSSMVKPAWNANVDLTLPLYEYEDNPYLKYAILQIRNEYLRNQINWIDGSELALKQRFFFYFFLGSKKYSEDLKETIKENSSRTIISDNIELKRILSVSSLRKHIESLTSLTQGKNDREYFDKVDVLLEQYNKRNDSRTANMAYDIIKLIRIIDGRDYCIEKDLEIFQYLLEFIDNKIEIADTNTFTIKGYKNVTVDDVEEVSDVYDDNNLIISETDNGTLQQDSFGYSTDDDFRE